MASIFWWVIFPYVTLLIMIVGVLYRYVFGQKTWAAPSTEFFEKKWLKWGSPLFHYGIIFAFFGHIMGIVIPMGFYNALGISNELYHFGAVYGGGLAGFMVVIGAVILLIRKIIIDPVRIHATFADFFTITALLIISAIGLYMTLFSNVTAHEFDYRTSIGPWFRGLFVFQPQYELMKEVPMLFKVHVITAFGLFASIPFTRLIHFYSVPVQYPVRSPQQYRARNRFKKKSV